MAWDTELTKSRLLDAAAAEFAEYGYAGARIDRIGSRAGVNKERIYPYFGSKAGLFEAVVSNRMAHDLEEIPFSGTGPDAVARFAGDYFDAAVSNPLLARLTAWEGLERSDPVGADERSARAEVKVAEIQRVLPELSHQAAQDLLLTIVSLSHGWAAGRNVSRTITGDPNDNSRRRAHVVAAVRAIASS